MTPSSHTAVLHVSPKEGVIGCLSQLHSVLLGLVDKRRWKQFFLCSAQLLVVPGADTVSGLVVYFTLLPARTSVVHIRWRALLSRDLSTAVA